MKNVKMILMIIMNELQCLDKLISQEQETQIIIIILELIVIIIIIINLMNIIEMNIMKKEEVKDLQNGVPLQQYLM